MLITEDIIDMVSGINWFEPCVESYTQKIEVTKRIAIIANNSFTEWKQNHEIRAAAYQYCRHSNLFPRGFYCPDPLEDICTSNESRGRLLLHNPGDALFKYCFDNSGKMIMVITRQDNDVCDNEWVELLFNLSGFRIGVERLTQDKTRCENSIRFEVVNKDKTQFCFAQTTSVFENNTCFVKPHIHTIITTCESGLPTKRVVFTEGPWDTEYSFTPICMLDIGQSSYYKTVKEMYSKRIISTDELEYSCFGYPTMYWWNGKECLIGRKKKPMTRGMYI